MGANKLLWDAGLSVEVAWRVKWKCRDRSTAVCIQAILLSADGEKGPSRWVACIGDAIGGSFEEIELVQGRRFDTTGQNGEELQEHATTNKDE